MPDLQTNDDNKPADAQTLLSGLHAWLDAPRSSSVAEDFTALRNHLRTAHALDLPLQQRTEILDRFYVRCMATVQVLRQSLVDVPLPVPGKIRQTIRSMQEMLDILARSLVELADGIDSLKRGTPAPMPLDLVLWRSLYTISRHLIIAGLTAAPPNSGAWRQLHQVYDHAWMRKLHRNTPDGATRSLQDVYYTAVLLGSAQPTSFTSVEVDFLDSYLERISNQIDLNSDGSDPVVGTFWIDPNCDSPAVPCVRRLPTPGIPVRYFSCERLSALLKIQLAKLEAGSTSEQVNLPKFAATTAGLGVLQRVIRYWGAPGKRRLQRRRQNYRGELCIGLNNICLLFQKADDSAKLSNWMITSESPDGYTVMHTSGKTGPVRGGDVAALRTEHSSNWQLCIIRRALSENLEHLELGLQILSVRAFTARLALPSETGKTVCLPALFLPPTPSLRPEETLVLPSGTLANRPKDLVLIIEKDNVELREISAKYSEEQNSQIEIYAIESELPPPSAEEQQAPST